jgi:inosose dehydratase
MRKNRTEQSRRRFLQATGIAAATLMTGANGCSLKQNQPRTKPLCKETKEKIKLGVASYTFKGFALDEALMMTKRVGLKYICLKSFHLPLDSTAEQIAAAVTKIKEAGLELYGGGVISMKTEDEVHHAFEYAKAAGMKVIVGVPEPELLELVDMKVRQYDIKVAIHNHGPEDKVYPTPASAYERIKKLDKRLGLCIDIGHTLQASVDPAASMEKFADRLLDVHVKDISGPTNLFKDVPVGRGIIDIPNIFRTLVNINYAGVASFEYEKDPQPLAGLAESVGYVRGVLAAI